MENPITPQTDEKTTGEADAGSHHEIENKGAEQPQITTTFQPKRANSEAICFA